jgi:hypothetical protein
MNFATRTPDHDLTGHYERASKRSAGQACGRTSGGSVAPGNIRARRTIASGIIPDSLDGSPSGPPQLAIAS